MRPGTLLTWFCWSALLLGGAARLESQELLKTVKPGFSGCDPAVFVPLRPEMTIRIFDIAYADTGMLMSFREEITYTKRDPVLLAVSVNLAKWTGMCSSLEYSVNAAGTTLTSPAHDGFDESKLPRTVAFPPDEKSGIVIAGGTLQGDLVTNLGYDAKGRRYISRQIFTAEGVTYEAVYSGYSYLPGGKIAAFSAQIRPVPK